MRKVIDLKTLSIGAALCLIASIAHANSGEQDPQADSQAQSCPVLESMNWGAWINAQPATSKPSLHVSGQVVLPTPGYSIQVKIGPLDRKNPPTQRLFLNFVEPEGMVAQVLTTENVAFSAPAQAETYESVMLICGDVILAEISNIETVH